MDNQAYYRRLVDRYLNKKATDDELEVFFHLIAQGILQPYLKEAMTTDAGVDASDEAEYVNTLDSKIRKFFLTKWFYGAAAVIFVVFFAMLYFHRSKTIVNDHPQTVINIGPGGNRATLTLADGSTITLDSAQNGIVIGHNGITYANGKELKNASGKVIAGPAAGVASEIPYFILSTPKGGQYQIALSDGSIVWLNSASTLKYPSRFSKDSRIVELEGEAYFSVNRTLAKDMSGYRSSSNTPFIVKSKGQQTTVLGTEFNITAYAEERTIKTTVVSGAVQVALLTENNKQRINSADRQAVVLRPGEQSVLWDDGKITKQKANVKSTVSWQNGQFSFHDESLENIMMQLARWYNLKVEYEGPIPDELYNGTISRQKNIDEVLAILSATKTVKFKIYVKNLPNGEEERRIVVK